MANKLLLFEMDDSETMIPYLVPEENWKEACEKLSGEGADTQLVNALEALGIEVFTQDKAGDDEG